MICSTTIRNLKTASKYQFSISAQPRLTINAACSPWAWHGVLSKQQILPCLLALIRPIFCILLFNWDSQETLSKVSAKHPSPFKQPKLSPLTNYPALPQRNSRSPDYISCYCIINVPQPAVISLILSYCADAGWGLTPTGLHTRNRNST